jgi:hypothetical protein
MIKLMNMVESCFLPEPPEKLWCRFYNKLKESSRSLTSFSYLLELHLMTSGRQQPLQLQKLSGESLDGFYLIFGHFIRDNCKKCVLTIGHWAVTLLPAEVVAVWHPDRPLIPNISLGWRRELWWQILTSRNLVLLFCIPNAQARAGKAAGIVYSLIKEPWK